jgi:hypothetical protein
MLEVETNHQIILLFFKEGLSIRSISKKLKINRRTVSIRIRQYEQFKASPISDQDNPGSLFNEYLKKGTVYKSDNRVKRKLNSDIIAIIDKCIAENEVKRLDGRIKQQLKRIDIHEKILSAGHSISYSVICDYIKNKVSQFKEGFIRQGYIEGSCCEFDWAEVKLNVDGKYRRYYLAVFTSAFSNYRYAMLFQHQDSLAFKEAHIRFFEHIGGVYHLMVYDNMRVAIAQFVGKNEKVPTDSLVQMSRWYQYKWRFCNIAKGNEKGHVERSVEYVRRKVFAFKDTFKSFEETQQYLLARVSELNGRPSLTTKISPLNLLENERKGLYGYPGLMECFAAENYKVDKYSTISFGTNRYSIPDHMIGKMVFVKIYSQKLKIFDGNKVLCQHERTYERFSWKIDLNHYMVTLKHKPGAVAGSVALKQAPDWVQSIYANHFFNDPRSFIELLQYCQTNNVDGKQVSSCVLKLSRQFAGALTTTHVIAMLGNQVQDVSVADHQPDSIAIQAMENLQQLEAMMINYN